MNNFPAMTEMQRQALIARCKDRIAFHKASGNTGTFDAVTLEIVEIALAALTADTSNLAELAAKVRKVREDAADFDGDRRGMWEHQEEQEPLLLEEAVKYTAPPAPVLRVPARWKLVPMVPTEAMIMAAQDSEDVLFDKDDDSLFIVDHKEIYRAMLENAPEASNEQ